MNDSVPYPAWVEVDTAAIGSNVTAVKSLVGPATMVCAVVKGNGYGHGAVHAARAALAGGAELLAVTTVDEASELRSAGLDDPILLLASSVPQQAARVAELGLVATVTSELALDVLSSAAVAAGREIDIHLLVDCGMGRDGALPRDVPHLVEIARRRRGLRLAGIYTHFPVATDRNLAPTLRAFDLFERLTAPYAPDLMRHAANSAATLALPETRLDMVRVGTLIYGQYPSAAVPRLLALRPTFRLCARLVEVRELPAGASIGYGSTCRLKRVTRVGTLLLGWQQGFAVQPESVTAGWRGLRRLLRSPGLAVTIGTRVCPVLGRVSMQSCAVDLGRVPEAAVGDVAVVPCRRPLVDRALPRIDATLSSSP